MNSRMLTQTDIPDDFLYRSILSALNCAPKQLTADKVLEIETFEVAHFDPSMDGYSLHNLQGLECLSNLKNLTIAWCDAKDISQIAKLTQLKKLSLALSCEPVDLAPLQNLIELQNLEIESCDASDLSPLCGLIQLKSLSFCNGDFGDLSCLKSLKNLKSLSVWVASAELGTLLRDLPYLTDLYIDLNSAHVPMQNLHWIQSMQNLQSLALVSDLLPQLQFIPSLNSLQSLNIAADVIGNLEPLSNLKYLQDLCIHSSEPLENAGVLSTLPTLSVLNIQTPTFSLSNSKELLNLKDLKIDCKQLENFMEISYLKQLQSLWLYGDFGYLSPLTNLEHLTTLVLNSDNLIDLSPLKHLRQLKTFFITSNKLRNISGISDIKSLEDLLIDGAVKDLSPLVNLSSLKRLELCNCKISDFSFLNGLKQLQSLSLEHCKISSFNSLKELPCLKNIRIGNSFIEDPCSLLDLQVNVNFYA